MQNLSVDNNDTVLLDFQENDLLCTQMRILDILHTYRYVCVYKRHIQEFHLRGHSHSLTSDQSYTGPWWFWISMYPSSAILHLRTAKETLPDRLCGSCQLLPDMKTHTRSKHTLNNRKSDKNIWLLVSGE